MRHVLLTFLAAAYHTYLERHQPSQLRSGVHTGLHSDLLYRRYLISLL
ncbi:hypothetical protein N374_gp094 [Bacillus phage phiNIT1]|uniref:Uncharacterized protein n=1 Tax=Bacillus phage phiNIT1 TaxID=207656 RepID=S6ANC6_9CAUD|nr:hypothetical protein N374_gp094 [Bacillus phage phiNIT1]BAN59518.1 hypothetical protein [Bacillus phage phiNIT1]